MTSRETYTIELPGDPRLLWALLSDTNRSSRAMGLARGRVGAGADGIVVEGRQLGLAIAWVSGPDSWVEGRWYRAVRHYRRGPAREATVDYRLEPRDGGCRVAVSRTTTGQLPAALFDKLIAGPKLRRYLRESAELAARGNAESWGLAPASASVRTLLEQTATGLLTGPAQPTNEAELAIRARRLRERSPDEALTERLLRTLRERPDEEVAYLSPFGLADLWGAPRRDVLRLFLLATNAGLLELHWNLRCQICRVPAGSIGSLAELPGEVRCPGCGATFGPDLAAHVEAAFSIHAALRPAQRHTYCLAGAAWRPHVFAQLVASPGAPCQVRAPLLAGELLLRAIGHSSAPQLLRPPHPASLTVAIHPDRVSVEASGARGAAETELTVRSESDGTAVVVLERVGWSDSWVSGADLASVPEFHELFAGEAPRSRHEVSVGGITLLFSDLRGSTAMYQRLGDPRAFTVVDGHFERLARIIEKNDGALVKTMGDAVMAVFQTPPAAVRAALEMQRALASLGGTEATLALKLGIHTGNCLAVRANGRLDFFGQAVNLAARAQAQSHGGDVVVTPAVLEHPEVPGLLERVAREEFEATLKGIDGPQKLWRLEPVT